MHFCSLSMSVTAVMGSCAKSVAQLLIKYQMLLSQQRRFTLVWKIYAFVQDEECSITKFTVMCMYICAKRLCSKSCCNSIVLVEEYTIIWLTYAMKMFCFIWKLVLNWFSLWFLKLVCSGLYFQFSADYLECEIRGTSLIISYMYKTGFYL